MRTGLKKTQKITEIYFCEASELITVVTYNTSLKKRLTAFSEEFPELCALVADDDAGCLTFEISKENFTFRVMKPVSNEKREKAREQMLRLRENGSEVSATLSETRKTLFEQKYGSN